MTLFCECNIATCEAKVEVSAEKSAAVMTTGNQYFISPACQTPITEEIVERGEGYVVVLEKAVEGVN